MRAKRIVGALYCGQFGNAWAPQEKRLRVDRPACYGKVLALAKQRGTAKKNNSLKIRIFAFLKLHDVKISYSKTGSDKTTI